MSAYNGLSDCNCGAEQRASFILKHHESVEGKYQVLSADSGSGYILSEAEELLRGLVSLSEMVSRSLDKDKYNVVSLSSVQSGPVLAVLLQQVRHERDVDDGQPQRVDTGQSLLVGECGNFPPQLVKRLVQAEHPLPLPHVGRLPLDHVDDPPPFALASVSVRSAAVAPRRAHHQKLGARLVFQVPTPGPQLVRRTGGLIIHLLHGLQSAPLRKLHQVHVSDETDQRGVP